MATSSQQSEPTVTEALEVLLAEVEDAIGHDYPQAYVGVEAATDRLTTDCAEPYITRLEHAPHRVPVELTDDEEFVPLGENDLIDAPWEETDSYWCHGCDSALEGELVARAHVKGIDLR